MWWSLFRTVLQSQWFLLLLPKKMYTIFERKRTLFHSNHGFATRNVWTSLNMPKVRRQLPIYLSTHQFNLWKCQKSRLGILAESSWMRCWRQFPTHSVLPGWSLSLRWPPNGATISFRLWFSQWGRRSGIQSNELSMCSELPQFPSTRL